MIRALPLLRHQVRRFVSARPALFFPFARRRPAYRGLLATPAADICIEGFPRSANSFAESAFRLAQTRPVQIAHHSHAPANLMRACRLGIPAVLLIRRPDEAVVSYRALILEASMVNGFKGPYHALGLADHLRAWIDFYERLRPYADRLVVATFEQVTADLGSVVRRVNDRFGTTFIPFAHTRASLARARERKGFHALPNERRRWIKLGVRQEFERVVMEEQPRLLRRADHLYGFFGARAGA